MQKKKIDPTYKSQQFAGKVVEIDVDGKKERKVVMNAPALYRHFLNTVCTLGDEISLYITNKRPKRSQSQNNYYFLYLSLIVLSSGHTIDELHIWAKGKFLSKGITEVFGDKTRIVNSTTLLTIGEFCEYLCRIEDETKIPCPKTDPFLVSLTHAEYDALKAEQKAAYRRMEAKIVIPNSNKVVHS